MIAKAITHFSFRNGMLAYIFSLIIENRWFKLKFLVNSIDKMFGHGWDDADLMMVG